MLWSDIVWKTLYFEISTAYFEYMLNIIVHIKVIQQYFLL